MGTLRNDGRWYSEDRNSIGSGNVEQLEILVFTFRESPSPHAFQLNKAPTLVL